MGLGGCRRDWCDKWNDPTLLLVPLLMMLIPAHGEVHWAYVPDPPLIHPAVWTRPEILVTSNNTQLLGPPWTREPTYNKTVTFNALGEGIPVCFVKNSINDGCISVFPQTWKKKVSQTVTQIINIGMPKHYKGSAPDPHELRPCRSKPTEDVEQTFDKVISWKECFNQPPMWFNVSNNMRIIDWAGNQSDIGQKEMSIGLWQSETGHFQRHIWKLAVALYKVTLITEKIETGSRFQTSVSACVKAPNLLLIGHVKITFVSSTIFNVSCIDCTLSNCVSVLKPGMSVMVVYQPAFVLLPVEITGPWYSEKSLQVLEEVSQALSRNKRVVGLIIAGIAALIALIASTTVSAIALTQEVKTATFVNHLAKNVTNALSIQEDLDRRLEQRIDALYDTIQIIGEQVQGLKVRSHLECHAKYQWICVTPKVYNDSHYSWERVQRHLQGIWHNSNTSLDVLALHTDIMNLKNAAPLSFDAANVADRIILALKSVFPSWSSLNNGIYGLIALALLVLGILLFLPIVLKLAFKSINMLAAQVHGLKLRMNPQTQSLI